RARGDPEPDGVPDRQPRADVHHHRSGVTERDAFDPVTFRRAAAQALDGLARYWETLETRPVLAQVKPGALRAALPGAPPEEPEPIERIVEDVFTTIVPGLTHWNHPGFLAYFASSSSAAGVLGELLAAGFNANAMLWRTSPA